MKTLRFYGSKTGYCRDVNTLGKFCAGQSRTSYPRKFICGGRLDCPNLQMQRDEVGSFLGRKNDSKQVLNQFAKLGGALGN